LFFVPGPAYNFAVETLDEIKARLEAAIPGAQLQVVPNDSPANQRSLLVDAAHASAVAGFLRDDLRLRLDFASNVTGIDWPDRVEKTKTKVKKTVEGVEKEVEETVEKAIPGYLEVVYHLYSMELKFQQGEFPQVIVRAPDLNGLAGGKDLPHVYEQEPPRLCLFLPWTGEWNPQRTLVETMLPWSVLWLYYFEVWLRSGEWTGGGMHPPASATKGKSSRSMAAG